MHLSLLSDASLSDLLDDCGTVHGSAGRQHLDGVLRGVLFASALVIPLALTFAPAALSRPHDAPVALEAGR